jgi:flagellar basal-body rod protein FlgF
VDLGSAILLGNELALRRRVDVIANNLANAQTSGFKREATVFRTRRDDMPAAPSAEQRRVYQVLDYGVTHDSQDGPFQPTGNPLDIAISGAGYLGVQAAGGGTAYTRAGALRVSAEGYLEAAGNRLLGEGGAPLQVPAEAAGKLVIAGDGTVTAGASVIGRIAVFAADESTADPQGAGIISVAGVRELPAGETRLRIGGIEGSNVQPVVESTRLIEAMRAYQSSQRMTEALGEMRRGAVERLGRLNN